MFQPPPPVANPALRAAPRTTWAVEGIELRHCQWAAPDEREALPATAAVWLLLCLRGRCRVRVGASGPALRLTGPQHTLLFGATTAGELTADAPDTEVVAVAWPAAAFAALAAELPAPLADVAAAIRANEPTTVAAAPISPSLHHAVRELLTPVAPGPLGLLRRRAQLWELVAAQAADLAAAPAPLAAAGATKLSEYDQERLRFARDYLIQHTQLPPTLPELARLAGLNECKLKRGFKLLFGQPAFAYLAEWRLLEARQRLLADPAVTASEVAFELGYASLPHFSAAFKHRFGRSPRTLRME